ncbi:Trafficking protein particle complex subunit BET5 [Friedmanniomyces endolithicus]|nr:Trafficking protein particle complex subunit BET5 [Friedmanniomyces endolithicus]
MSVYSFYIFDRHTECIYSKRFTQQPSPPRTTSTTLRNGTTVPPSLRQANKDSDDAKLVFGTVFSLRRMCRQLGGCG